MVTTITNALAAGIVVSDIIIVVFVILWLLKATLKISLLDKIISKISPKAWTLAFLVALTSMLGSLFFSEIAKFQPCILCWYQRIFMYPIPLLLYISMIKNDTSIKPHVIILSTIGAIIAIYHYFIQLFPESHILPCEAFSPVSCTEGYTFYFGYISIPMMSATAFILIIILLLLAKSKKHA